MECGQLGYRNQLCIICYWRSRITRYFFEGLSPDSPDHLAPGGRRPVWLVIHQRSRLRRAVGRREACGEACG
jgi:hypothetical protein